MRETTVTIDGNPYRLTGLDARQTQEFMEYARKAMPDPVDDVLAVAAKLPDGKVKDEFLARHLDQAFDRQKLRGTLGDPDLEGFTKTPEGYRKLFGLMFKKHHPHLTEDQAFDLVVKAVEEHGEGVFADLYTASNRVPVAEEDVERKYFRGPRPGTRKK